MIGIQISSSEFTSLFLYFSPNTSKCGRLSKTYEEEGSQDTKYVLKYTGIGI
jgi:hypothetical protein